MKFIRDLISRKSSAPVREDSNYQELAELAGGTPEEPKIPLSQPLRRARKLEVRDDAPAAPAAPARQDQDEAAFDAASALVLDNMKTHLGGELPTQDSAAKADAKPVVNIWDLDEDAEAPAAATPEPSSRRRRNKTRMLGFDTGGGDVVSMFDDASAAPVSKRTQFPVGWILVVEGAGRGECFTLEPGMSQIGRGNDQAIQLDFGDNSISRSNHAAVVYDTETSAFTIGHGGKKNIVRLNGNPVISNEKLKTGDKIKIGETTLHFVALCSEEFNWAEDATLEESNDVAIA